MNRDRVTPGVWAIWFSAVLISVSLTKNPLYLVIIFLAVTGVLASKSGSAPAGPWNAFIRIGLTFALVSLIYNILISHHGDTVIVVLPGWIPIIGGPLSLEAAVFGASFGVTFLCGLLAFAVLNIAVGVSEMLRILPGWFRGAATAISVSLNFIPATIAAATEIGQAQTIRRISYGKGLSGKIRKAGAAFVPLVISGLEKATVTAESMESRAYGGGEVTKLARTKRAWLISDYLMAAASLIPVAALVFCLVTGTGWLVYSPYPKLGVPGFSPIVGACLALLAVPAAIKR